MIEVADIPQSVVLHRQVYQLGVKLAADGVPAYNLAGMFQLSHHKDKPWGILSVPNALVRGVFDALHEPGVELPLDSAGQLNAHISVMSPEDIAMVGGPEALANDRGHQFSYNLGRLVRIDDPGGWPEMRSVFALLVHAPQLQALRRSYGLSSLPHGGEYAFHVTVGRVKRAVTGRNDKAKDTTAA